MLKSIGNIAYQELGRVAGVGVSPPGILSMLHSVPRFIHLLQLVGIFVRFKYQRHADDGRSLQSVDEGA